MKKKRIIAGILAFTLIGFILFIANAFIGNPISKMLANRAAEKYVEQNYGDLDLELEKATYNFKDGNYTVYAESKKSIDTHFYLNFSGTGQFMYDDYETSVLSKFNTWERIDKEYREWVDTVFMNDFPYESDIAFGEIPGEEEDQDALELDRYYDIRELGEEKGHITLYVNSNELTGEKAKNILLDLKKLFDKQQIAFYSIDLTLQEPLSETKEGREDITMRQFLYSDIKEDGLQEKVDENIKQTKEYYDEMDKEMEAEIDDTTTP